MKRGRDGEREREIEGRSREGVGGSGQRGRQRMCVQFCEQAVVDCWIITPLMADCENVLTV